MSVALLGWTPSPLPLDPNTVIRPPGLHHVPWRRLDLGSQLMVRAAAQARPSGLPPEPGVRGGVFVGSQHGCMATNLLWDAACQGGGAHLPATMLLFKHTVANAPAFWVGATFGLRGESATYTSGPLAAADALWDACATVEEGGVEVAVVGALELVPALSRRLLNPGHLPPDGAWALWVGQSSPSDLVTITRRIRWRSPQTHPSHTQVMARVGDLPPGSLVLSCPSRTRASGAPPLDVEQPPPGGELGSLMTPAVVMDLVQQLQERGGGTGVAVVNFEGEHVAFVLEVKEPDAGSEQLPR